MGAWDGRRDSPLSAREQDEPDPIQNMIAKTPRGIADGVPRGGYMPMQIPVRSVHTKKIKHPDWVSLESHKKTHEAMGLLRTVGILHEPCIRHLGHGTYEVIWGEYIIAAARMEGWEKLQCKVLQCDSYEGQLWKLSHATTTGNPSEKRLARQQLLELKLSKVKQGRGSTTMKRGIRQMFADMLQIPYSKVLDADERHKAEASRRYERRKQINRGAIEDHGCAKYLDHDFLVSLNQTAEAISELHRKCKAAIPRLVKYAGPLFHGAEVAEMTGMLRQIASTFHAMQPRYLCPYCKGLSRPRASCARCKTRGFLLHGETDDIPSVLWDHENPQVMVNGELKPISEYQDRDPKETAVREIPRRYRKKQPAETCAPVDDVEPNEPEDCPW